MTSSIRHAECWPGHICAGQLNLESYLEVGPDDDDRRAFCQHTVLTCMPTALKPNFPFCAVSRARYDLVDIVGEGEHFPPLKLYLIPFSQYVLMFQNFEDMERRKKSLQMAVTSAPHQLSWCGGRRL